MNLPPGTVLDLLQSIGLVLVSYQAFALRADLNRLTPFVDGGDPR